MRRQWLAAAFLLGLAVPLLPAAPAQAHPLGNFTTNQYAGLRVTADGIDIDYVLDLAELPAYQVQREEIDADADGAQTPEELAAYAERTCSAVGTATIVTVASRQLPISAHTAGLTFPPGAGGLRTLRLQCVLHAGARISGDTTVGYRSTMFADRVGWREITAVGDRFTVTRSTVPAASVSAQLTAYPIGAVTLDVRAANLTVRAGGPAAPPAPFAAPGNRGGSQARDVDAFTRWFTDLVGTPELTVGVGILAFLVALVLGGAHAVAPGHGKTIMAAYLIGSRGRLPQALTVAGTVAATHTLGVLALGIVLATSLQLAPDTMYAWLRLASGVLVALVGAHLLYRARAHPITLTHVHQHEHELVPAGHAHHHDPAPVHSHGGGRPHSHDLPDPDAPIRVRTLLAMGFAGGLSPSPSAVVVLLGAAALGRAWYGVLLVLAYGIGLAATLTGIGFALARWGERLRVRTSGRWARSLLTHVPTATAAVIVVVGLGMIAYSAVSLRGA